MLHSDPTIKFEQKQLKYFMDCLLWIGLDLDKLIQFGLFRGFLFPKIAYILKNVGNFREQNVFPQIFDLLLTRRKWKRPFNHTLNDTYLPLQKQKGLVFKRELYMVRPLTT